MRNDRSPRRVAIVVGTRPEFIKLASTVRGLRVLRDLVETVLIFTGQHQDIGPKVARALNLDIDVYIPPMEPNRSISELLGHLIPKLSLCLDQRFDFVVAQGDTISTTAASIASYLLQIHFIHVEAGLRSLNAEEPFPEEMNRRLISSITSTHICTVARGKYSLLSEGHAANTIYVVGNPLRDHIAQYPEYLSSSTAAELVLVTVHRREKRAERLQTALRVLVEFASSFPRVRSIFVWHPSLNSNFSHFRGDLEKNGIEVLDPMEPGVFLGLLRTASTVITDSAGIGEECHLLGVPAVLLRSAVEIRSDEVGAADQIASEDQEEISAFLSKHVGMQTSRRLLTSFPADAVGNQIASIIAEAQLQ